MHPDGRWQAPALLMHVVGAAGSMSRSAPPRTAPTRPLNTDVTGLHGPSAPQAACHGATPYYPENKRLISRRHAIFGSTIRSIVGGTSKCQRYQRLFQFPT